MIGGVPYKRGSLLGELRNSIVVFLYVERGCWKVELAL